MITVKAIYENTENLPKIRKSLLDLADFLAAAYPETTGRIKTAKHTSTMTTAMARFMSMGR